MATVRQNPEYTGPVLTDRPAPASWHRRHPPRGPEPPGPEPGGPAATGPEPAGPAAGRRGGPSHRSARAHPRYEHGPGGTAGTREVDTASGPQSGASAPARPSAGEAVAGGSGSDFAHLAVQRAIETMWKHYNEPISLADLADAAILSRFYFSRVFRGITGTSPGRFLAAIRLYRAKQLLRQTSMSVIDISYDVGYNSPGSFTSRFTRSVGMAPTQYREYAQADAAGLVVLVPDPDRCQCCRSTVSGRLVVSGTDCIERIYVGAFHSAVPEGVPVSCSVVSPVLGDYRLDDLPVGTWYLRAVGVGAAPGGVERRGTGYAGAVGRSDVAVPGDGPRVFVGTGPAVAADVGSSMVANITLRAQSVFDLPILLALPDLDIRRGARVYQPVG